MNSDFPCSCLNPNVCFFVYLTTIFQLCKLHSFEYEGGCNELVTCGRKQLWPILRHYLPEESDEIFKKEPQSIYPSSMPTEKRTGKAWVLTT
jgi:hypothetical protein